MSSPAHSADAGDAEADYEGIVVAAEELLEKHNIKIPVAVMGCEVNGPGETRKRRGWDPLGRQRTRRVENPRREGQDVSR